MDSDLSYFSYRAEEELRAATATLDPKARRTHLDMASRYADVAQAIMAHDRTLYGDDSNHRGAAKPQGKWVGLWL